MAMLPLMIPFHFLRWLLGVLCAWCGPEDWEPLCWAGLEQLSLYVTGHIVFTCLSSHSSTSPTLYFPSPVEAQSGEGHLTTWSVAAPRPRTGRLATRTGPFSRIVCRQRQMAEPRRLGIMSEPLSCLTPPLPVPIASAGYASARCTFGQWLFSSSECRGGREPDCSAGTSS